MAAFLPKLELDTARTDQYRRLYRDCTDSATCANCTFGLPKESKGRRQVHALALHIL